MSVSSLRMTNYVSTILEDVMSEDEMSEDDNYVSTILEDGNVTILYPSYTPYLDGYSRG